jgi:hypothetical protein
VRRELMEVRAADDLGERISRRWSAPRVPRASVRGARPTAARCARPVGRRGFERASESLGSWSFD